MTAHDLWDRYKKYLCRVDSVGLTVDVSRMTFDEPFQAAMAGPMQKAFAAMDALEKGAIANPPKFTHLISVGIGGSALGPEFVADALGSPTADKMVVHFVDNTDPDGIARVLATVGDHLPETLTIVCTKSGGTPETRNGMLLMADAYKKAGLDVTIRQGGPSIDNMQLLAAGAVDFAIGSNRFGPLNLTQVGSKMDAVATGEKWLARFPMFDWIGGRTSELSAVGLLPAALQGVDVDAMLAGAAAIDAATRVPDVLKNPAALLAVSWYHATGGKGQKDMVVLPYKDRLLLFSRYLQQLVMESLGKRLDLDGKRVDQGISVYGNKGTTDQHAYVQQLRDGVNNFFVVFVRVLLDGGSQLQVEPDVTAGDYLHGLQLGTREALYSNDRQSITISIPTVSAREVGVLIALFERAVGYYGTLVNVNAYHQPGVEAGKKAAAAVLALQTKVLGELTTTPQRAEEIAAKAGSRPTRPRRSSTCWNTSRPTAAPRPPPRARRRTRTKRGTRGAGRRSEANASSAFLAAGPQGRVSGQIGRT